MQSIQHSLVTGMIEDLKTKGERVYGHLRQCVTCTIFVYFMSSQPSTIIQNILHVAVRECIVFMAVF